MTDFHQLDYQHEGIVCRDELFLPSATVRSAQPAGVLVLPEWWGLNAFAVERARRLARLGFAALAVDL